MVQGDVEPQQPPHFTLRQGGHRKVRKSCHPTIGEAIQRRHAPREIFLSDDQKKGSEPPSWFHLTPLDTPSPPKTKKTLQEYMNIILGYFFDWILFDKNTDGYPQKKELDLHEKGLGVENWLRETKTTQKPMVIFVMTRYSRQSMVPLLSLFLFSARFIGEKKEGKDNCPKQTTSKQPGLHFLLILNQEALPSPLMLSKAFLAAFAALKRFEPRVMWSDRVLWRVDWRGRVCF